MFGNIFTFKINETLAQTLQTLLDTPIIELDSIDSTNNYAMQLIDADTAQDGLTIITREQTRGKGQRGRIWVDAIGESVLMSIVVKPNYNLDDQFLFNANIAISIAELLTDIYENWNVKIKWPNDIIVNDKKAGGVLIENVLRGSTWMYSIVGIGINVLQNDFPNQLPYATSLKMESNKDFEIALLAKNIRSGIFKKLTAFLPSAFIINEFNSYLFRKDQLQLFLVDGVEEKYFIDRVSQQGKLIVHNNSGKSFDFTHGKEEWIW